MDDFQVVSESADDDQSVIQEDHNLEEERWAPEGAALIVDLLFKCALRRAPDPAAMKAYTTALVSGSHTANMIVAELINSEEARRIHTQQIEQELAYAIYSSVLGRDPEENEASRFVNNLDREALKVIFSEIMLRPEALRHQLKVITRRFGIVSVLLSQADADRAQKEEPKTKAKAKAKKSV